MKIVIEFEVDRLPVETVAGREQLERDLLGAIAGVLDRYGSPCPRKMQLQQEDD
jgi:hypothetical protein